MEFERLKEKLSSLKQRLMERLGSWKENVGGRLRRANQLVLLPLGLTMLALVLLLFLITGCATPSPMSKLPAANPSKPAPSQSQPSEPYLERVKRNIEAWDKKLRDMLQIP